MKIIIAGYGPVGQAVHAALEMRDDVDIYIDDPYQGYNYANGGWQDDPDGVIVCVATPPNEDGSCDVTNVDDVFEKYIGTRFLIKSTTDPLWLRDNADADVTFSPEFLRGTTGNDPTQEFLDSEFAIYGGGHMRWWYELFKPVLPKCKTVRFVSLEQAAFAKYVENCFLATKVTFFNEMYQIYRHLGFRDFDTMVEAISIDPRIGLSHTQVPGPDGKHGYGGHCFPKDVSAMIQMAINAGADPAFLSSVRQANRRFRGE